MSPKEIGQIVGAYTGFLCGDFSDLQEYIEKLLSRPVWTHEMANENLMNRVKDAAKPDFLRLANWCAGEK